MNTNYRKCVSCNRILGPRESCTPCTDKRRQEAIAKAGPRAEPSPQVIRGTWLQLELTKHWLPHSLPPLKRDAWVECMKVIYRG